MTDVTVSRGNRSVTFEVYERANTLMIARDAGKPSARVYRTGRQAPLFADHRSPIEGYTIVGQMFGEGAYEDARLLAEGIVRARSGGQTTTLDLSEVTGLDSVEVGFPGDSALKLGYPPGQGEWVSLQMTCIVVDNVIGSSSQSSAGSGASGDGPVTVSRDQSSITIENDIDMERVVGRPDNTTRHATGENPYMVDRPRSFNDVFKFNGKWVTNAEEKQRALIEEMIKPQLGYDTFTLNFNGTYGLGEYTVAPIGSRSARVSWNAFEKGIVHLDNLELTVVRD